MSILQALYRLKQRDFMEKLREMSDPSVIYVTDLVQCSHKRVMRIMYPLMSFRFEPPLVLGDLVHAGLEALLSEEGWEAEVPVEASVEVGDETYVVKGRVDLLKRNEEGRPVAVVEIKTGRDLPDNSPREHHVAQVQVYMSMLGAREGYLVYITPERLVEFPVEPVSIDLESLVEDVVYDRRAPRYEWECRYCPYRRICPYAHVR